MYGEAQIDPAELDLPRRVHACVAGDWLVFLDLTQDRYFAVSASENLDTVRETIRSKLPDVGPGVASQKVDGWFGKALSFGPDWLRVAEACWWAHRIISRRRLDRAFDWVEMQKTKASKQSERGTVTSVHETFERLRAWIPHRYVCLFNSLALIRYLTRCGFEGSLVFGVRGMPFAAHCWVEAAGSILDAGEEDCGAFIEIARV